MRINRYAGSGIFSGVGISGGLTNGFGSPGIGGIPIIRHPGTCGSPFGAVGYAGTGLITGYFGISFGIAYVVKNLLILNP